MFAFGHRFHNQKTGGDFGNGGGVELLVFVLRMEHFACFAVYQNGRLGGNIHFFNGGGTGEAEGGEHQQQ